MRAGSWRGAGRRDARRAAHPYTRGLLDSVPASAPQGRAPAADPGRMPALAELPPAAPSRPAARAPRPACAPPRRCGGRARHASPPASTRSPAVAGMTAPLLEARGLTKHFGGQAAVLWPARCRPWGWPRARAVRAVDGRQLHPAARRGAGRRGRVRLRQVHARAHGGGADDADIGRILHEGRRAPRGGLDRQMIFQDPFSSLNPRHAGGRVDRRGAARPPHRVAEGLRTYVDSLMDRCGIDPMSAPLRRTSSRAASASASASRARWR
jgi:ABC-type glutathione transport system ATPase component